MKFFKSLPKAKLQQLIMAVIGSLIALACVGNYFIAKELSTISEQDERITKLTADVHDAEVRQKAEASNEGLREQMKAFVDEQRQSMVTGDAFDWVVREANLLAEKRVVRDLALSPVGKSDGPHFQLFVTHINFTGSYDEVGKFIRDIENRFPLSQIRNLSLSSNGGDQSCLASLEIGMAVRPADPVIKPVKKKDKTGKKTEEKKA